ncbi:MULTISPECIES: hypothetical protein [Acidobacteriaceae]|uniref:hypothetical protein n=1 Tax=Acidobacteriaceae TaxID=204434 RepID=UPI00131DEA1B|nr:MULTISPECIES: hypothetical protein [Acidobacteriaceae]MDW5266061.1 hypothetical protein [Edaphobacter sp.]
MSTATVIHTDSVFESELASKVGEPRFQPWAAWERFLFRTGTIFVIQMIAPIRLQNLKGMVRFTPGGNFVGPVGIHYLTPTGESGRWGLGGFVNWGISLLIALAIAGIWTWLARNSRRKEYTVAYYWLSLFVRYWTAVSLLHYGYVKVYPNQMPFPSFANAHTAAGDIAPYRYWWAIVGLSTWYQISLGVTEVFVGTLLFFRRTLALGSLLTLGVVASVAYGNFAYDGGVHVLATEIALFAGFLLLPYLRDTYRLLIKREDVVPSYYHPVFRVKWQRYAFTGFKYVAWALLIPVSFYNNNHHYLYTNQSKEPRAPGLSGAKGYYNVTEFKLDGKDVPYSPLDPVRWHDATFEDYPTFTFKVDKPLPIRLENGGQGTWDAQKRYELAGYSGGRTYLHYALDEANQTLTVQDKNADASTRNADDARGTPALLDSFFKRDTGADAKLKPDHKQGAGGGRGGKGANRKDVQKLVWHYTRPSPTRVILTGNTFDGHEFYAVLDRLDENQAIHISSPVQGEPLIYGLPFSRRYPVTPASFDGTADSANQEQAVNRP